MLAAIISILLFITSAGSDINNSVRQYLNAHLKEYEKIEFEILKTPAGYSSIDILKSKAFNVNGNIAYIPVKIIKKKRTVQSYISVRLKLFKKVLIVNRNINRKESINKNDFMIGLKDVAGLQGEPVTEIKDLENCRSKKYLKEGNILTKNDIEKLPVINIGDRIKASLINGNVMVQTEAVSRQEGRIGDEIIIVTMANKRLKARVVDKNNVIIIE